MSRFYALVVVLWLIVAVVIVCPDVHRVGG